MLRRAFHALPKHHFASAPSFHFECEAAYNGAILMRGVIALVAFVIMAWPTLASAQSASPAAIATSYIRDINAGQVQAAAALFSPDAAVSSPLGDARGRAQITAWLQDRVAEHFHADPLGAPSVAGATVKLRHTLADDTFLRPPFSQPPNVPLQATTTITIRSGLIGSLTTVMGTVSAANAGAPAPAAAQAPASGAAGKANVLPKSGGSPEVDWLTMVLAGSGLGALVLGAMLSWRERARRMPQEA